MSIHTNDVFDYLDTHPVCLHDGDFQSLLEMLHYIYSASNPIDSDAIREGFRGLGPILDRLPGEESETLFSLTCGLCHAHELAGFSHGLTVGMHLMTEVNALP